MKQYKNFGKILRYATIYNINNDIKHEEKDGDFSELNIYGIKIQCPDCGNIFIMDEFGEYFCKRCDRVFPEDEIRERCGL